VDGHQIHNIEKFLKNLKWVYLIDNMMEVALMFVFRTRYRTPIYAVTPI